MTSNTVTEARADKLANHLAAHTDPHVLQTAASELAVDITPARARAPRWTPDEASWVSGLLDRANAHGAAQPRLGDTPA